ncbi:tetratricopeptide repeat protein [Nonomuraea sp. NPDC048826]|uniref:tetratricopeptide repeat protein n=1 Tax=Nonomuraea sp. NPDC048826 TaxID=3364347 RepID=UPI00371C8FC7
MAKKPRTTALDAFVGQLTELVALAGSPTLSELRKISRNSSRDLAESTTHDILTGKRKRAPDWPWVHSFVMACRTAAERTGLDIRPLDDVKTWHHLWRAARETPGGPAESPPVPAAPAVPERPVREDLLRAFGRIGLRLLAQSDRQDPRDCLRLAVVALLRGHPDDARPWLRLADEAGSAEATALLDHPRRRQMAARLAYTYGRDFEQASPGNLHIAMFYYRLAAEAGHTEAAYRLGLVHHSRDERGVAASWFHRAADDGHPEAVTELNGSARQPAGRNAAGLKDRR